MVRRALAALALLVLTLLPTGSAQTEANVEVAIEQVPTQTVNTNDTVYVEPFTLNLSMQNVVCSSPTVFVFEVTPSGSAGGNRTVAFELTPARPGVSVPAGQHVVAAFTGSTEATLQIRPSSVPDGGAMVNVTIGARGSPQGTGCQANGGMDAQAEPKQVTIHFRRATEAPVVEPSPEMPAPGLALAALALLGALAFTRGRRGA